MKIFTFVTLLLFLTLACQKTTDHSTEIASENNDTKSAYATVGSIERLDPLLDQLIPHDAEIELLATGFDWTEGPLWIAEGGYLLFSDIPPNTVYRWKEGDSVSVYLKPSGYTGTTERGGEVGSNGLLLNSAGQLVLCQHGDRRMAVMDAHLTAPESNFVTIVDEYQGQRFNSPNDAAYHSNGDLYFTDPPYGLEQQVEDPSKEIDFQGVYKASPEGEVTLLVDSLTRPNGIAFSHDEKTLYVANSDSKRAIWAAYDVQPNGLLANGRVLFDANGWTADRKGLSDGLKVNRQGYLFATGPGGVHILDAEGKHLGTIQTGQATSNCALDEEGGFIYLTADMHLLRVPLVKN
ncbi:MAG: SMP-30/gluconolactonase/LRE family protein [Cyclobacteriaceae bacterium]